MAVMETLLHPFATAKIVVWPATCSVRGGLIIAARSRDACGDATLCACWRRGERTGNHCDCNEGSKYLLHSRPPVRAWRAATRPPHYPRQQEIPAVACQPLRAIVPGQLSALIGAGFELLVCKVLMSELGQTEKNSVRAYVFRHLKLGHCSMHSSPKRRRT